MNDLFYYAIMARSLLAILFLFGGVLTLIWGMRLYLRGTGISAGQALANNATPQGDEPLPPESLKHLRPKTQGFNVKLSVMRTGQFVMLSSLLWVVLAYFVSPLNIDKNEAQQQVDAQKTAFRNIQKLRSDLGDVKTNLSDLPTTSQTQDNIAPLQTAIKDVSKQVADLYTALSAQADKNDVAKVLTTITTLDKKLQNTTVDDALDNIKTDLVTLTATLQTQADTLKQLPKVDLQPVTKQLSTLSTTLQSQADTLKQLPKVDLQSVTAQLTALEKQLSTVSATAPKVDFSELKTMLQTQTGTTKPLPSVDLQAITHKLTALESQLKTAVATPSTVDFSTLDQKLANIETRLSTSSPAMTNVDLAPVTDKLAALQEQIITLQNSTPASSTDLTATSGQLQALQTKLETLQTQWDKAQQTLQTVSAGEESTALAALTDSIAALKTQVAALPKVDTSSLEAQLKALNERVTNLPTADTTELQTQFSNLANEVAALSEAVVDVPQTLQKLTSIQEQAGSTDTPTVDTTALQEQLTNLANDVALLNQAMGEVPQTLQKLSVAQEQTANKPATDNSNLQQQITGLSNDVTNLTKAAGGVSQAVQKLFAAQEQAANKPAADDRAVKTQLDSLSKQMDGLLTKVTEVSHAPVSDTEGLKVLRTDMNLLKTGLAALQRQLQNQAAAATNADSKTVLTSIQTDIANLKQGMVNLQTQTEQQAQMTAKLTEVQTGLNALQNQLQTSLSSEKTVQERLQQISDAVKMLQNQTQPQATALPTVDNMSKWLSSLQTDLREMKTAFTAMQKTGKPIVVGTQSTTADIVTPSSTEIASDDTVPEVATGNATTSDAVATMANNTLATIHINANTPTTAPVQPSATPEAEEAKIAAELAALPEDVINRRSIATTLAKSDYIDVPTQFVDGTVDKLIAPEQLNEIGKALQHSSLNNKSIRLIGYTDSFGARSNNQYLSTQRAQYIKDYLVQTYGLNPDLIAVEGRGEADPIAPNNTAEGQRKNRRIRIVIEK